MSQSLKERRKSPFKSPFKSPITLNHISSDAMFEILSFIYMMELYDSQVSRTSKLFLEGMNKLENVLRNKNETKEKNPLRFYHILTLKQTPVILKINFPRKGYLDACHMCIPSSIRVKHSGTPGKSKVCKICNRMSCPCHYIVCPCCQKKKCMKRTCMTMCMNCKRRVCEYACSAQCGFCYKKFCVDRCTIKIGGFKKRICLECDSNLKKIYCK